MRNALFVSAIALLLLGGCATSTPYVAGAEEGYGYSDQKIEDNRWMVNFAGNSLTDRQTVETYLLYRAAELTDQAGYDHFRVVRRETDSKSRFLSTGRHFSPYYSGFYPSYGFYGHHGFYRPHHFGGFGHGRYGYGFDDSDLREITRYEAHAEIIMGKGQEPPDDPAYFDADEVLTNLAGRITRPEA